MVLKVSLVIVLEVLSSVTDRITSQPTVAQFCFEEVCYIQPETSVRSWKDAQQVWRWYNSTLPIVDNPERQTSFAAALYNFTLNGTAEVWLGATAFDDGSTNWRWLDGSPCDAALIQGNGDYNRSYVFITQSDGTLILHASEAYMNHSYLCQYNNTNEEFCTNSKGRFVKNSRCYEKYDDNLKLSCFNARYNCLAEDGDLASFADFSVLHGIFDTNGSWVGLRHSQWNWQNAVTGLSSDVKFTSWSGDQPDDATPTCISIDYANFPNWKDWNCSYLTRYICQVLNETSLTPMEGPPVFERSTTSGLPMGASGAAGNSFIYKVNVPLAIGLGVGLGGAAIIAIIIIIVVRRQHRKSRSIGNSKPREEYINRNIQMNPENRETKMKETDAKSRSNDVSTEYATVQEARDIDSQLSPTTANQGPVYADLGFGEGSS